MSEPVPSETETPQDPSEFKGRTKSNIIFPKIPLINKETGKRHDEREPSQIRPIFVQTGVRGGVRGSSYIELGDTKVICVISGPKDLPRKVEFSSTGLLLVEIQGIGVKVQEKDIVLIKQALEAVIILEKFPKCQLDISLTILEDNGSSMSACITAAGLALMDAGVPIYDIPVGSTLCIEKGVLYLDPTKTELNSIELTNEHEGDVGVVSMGYMPSRDQICLFTMEGKIKSSSLPLIMDSLTKTSLQVFSLIRHLSTQKASKEMEEDK